MPIIKKFILKSVDDEHMLIPLLEDRMDFSKIYNLTETGAFIYKELENNQSIDDIALKMTKEYAVSLEQALLDVKKFIDKLKKLEIYVD